MSHNQLHIHLGVTIQTKRTTRDFDLRARAYLTRVQNSTVVVQYVLYVFERLAFEHTMHQVPFLRLLTECALIFLRVGSIDRAVQQSNVSADM